MPDRDEAAERRSGVAEKRAESSRGAVRTFRPALPLRILAGATGAVCAVAAGWEVWLAIEYGPRHLAAVAVLAFPCGVAAALLTRRLTVLGDLLESASLLGIRRVPWSRITRVDRFRRSFVVETDSGPVSAGWLAEREELLRLIVDRAHLGRVYDGLPWGVIERYAPRSQPIEFRPHHLRRRGEDPPEEPAG